MHSVHGLYLPYLLSNFGQTHAYVPYVAYGTYRLWPFSVSAWLTSSTSKRISIELGTCVINFAALFSSGTVVTAGASSGGGVSSAGFSSVLMSDVMTGSGSGSCVFGLGMFLTFFGGAGFGKAFVITVACGLGLVLLAGSAAGRKLTCIDE